MKNKLPDLNNHLFAQMERLSEEDITPDELERESKRAKAMVSISKEIISGAQLQLAAAEAMSKSLTGPLIEGKIDIIDKPRPFKLVESKST